LAQSIRDKHSCSDNLHHNCLGAGFTRFRNLDNHVRNLEPVHNLTEEQFPAFSFTVVM